MEQAFQVRWDEYKTVQDKIDRIGDFRFRLRGWLVTLMTAAVGAGALSGQLTYAVFIFGAVAVFAFHRLEGIQSRWERALGNRAAALEAELRDEYGAPGIVAALTFAHNAARQRRFWGRLFVNDASVFYGIMYAAALIGLFSTIDRGAVFDFFVESVEALGALLQTIYERLRQTST